MSFAELKLYIKQIYKTWALSILRAGRGNVTYAAKIAQMDRANFLRILRRLGIKREEEIEKWDQTISQSPK